MARNRASVGSKNHNAKLTEEQVSLARKLTEQRNAIPTIKDMAEQWGVNHDVLSRAIKGESWRHVS